MVERRSNRSADMLLGAGLVLIGMVAGGALFGSSGASVLAAGEQTDFSPCLPAISIDNGVALAKESQGHYIIISQQGWAKPVRVRDTDLRNSPGDSFVYAP